MANALERAMASSKRSGLVSAAPDEAGTPEAARKALIVRLKALDEAKIVKLVETLKLPATTSKWSLEQLREVVVTIETGAAPAKAPAPAKQGRKFTLIADKETHEVISLTEGMPTEGTEVPDNGQMTIITGPDSLSVVPTETLLALYNIGKNTKAKKFASPEAATQATYDVLGTIVDNAASRVEATAKKAATKAAKPAKEPAASKVIDYPAKPKGEQKIVKAGTKIAQLIDLLAQKDGTTIQEIESTLSATGKPISARAWLGYDLRTVAGYGARQDGDRLFLVLPAGMKAPLEHRTPEDKPVVEKAEKAPKVVAEKVVAEKAPKAEKAAAKPALVVDNGGAAKETASERMTRINAAKRAAKEAEKAAAAPVVAVEEEAPEPPKPAAKKAAKKAAK